MKLTKTIFLYLNEKEFSMLTKDAERANMSMSRYIRHQIDNAKMKPMHMARPNGRFCGAKRPKCEAEQPLGFD